MIKITSIVIALVICFSGSAMAAPSAGDTMIESVSGMRFSWVPKGCFLPANTQVKAVIAKKGADDGMILTSKSRANKVTEFDALDVEASPPVVLPDDKKTCFSKGYWIGSFEITQAQYQQLMGNNPSSFKQGDQYPVENVRWLDARSFIRKLNKAAGKRFRLPTETEWEYAARFGDYEQKFAGSATANDAGWFLDNSDNSTHPVGQKTANALSIFDMSGNVWEWTQDCWNERINAAPKDGSAWKSGNCAVRVLRGGSWHDTQSMISTKARLFNDTDKFDNNSGFRIVLD